MQKEYTPNHPINDALYFWIYFRVARSSVRPSAPKDEKLFAEINL